MSMNKPPEQRFWEKVNKNTDTECWEWMGLITTAGYGQISINTKKTYTHRYSAELAGMNTDGLLVCHSCDNRKCVNPKHLFLGTYKDNTQDMLVKGRSKNAETSKKRRKLTDEEVREIRVSSLSCVKAGKKYGVGKSIIHHIRKGNTYRDVV
jgi:hypothetical protein